jgi:hypothetical protein
MDGPSVSPCPHPICPHSNLIIYIALYFSLLTEVKCFIALEVEFSLLDHKSGIYTVAGFLMQRQLDQFQNKEINSG